MCNNKKKTHKQTSDPRKSCRTTKLNEIEIGEKKEKLYFTCD